MNQTFYKSTKSIKTDEIKLSNKQVHRVYYPKVSIVMTVYNHEDYVKEAIDSVLRQSFKDYELIIVNDGSTDHTKGIIQTYEDNQKIRIFNIEHVGRAGALNIGFKIATGEYVSVIDSDDLYRPHKILKQVEYLDNHPNIALLGCNAMIHNLSTNEVYEYCPPTDSKMIRKKLIFETVFPFPAIMVRKDILEMVEYCNQNLKSKIDLDLFGKIASIGTIMTIPKTLVTIRVHSRNFFKIAFSAENHTKTRLKIRWMNLWRIKPEFMFFVKTMMWLGFEYIVNIIPIQVRHLLPNRIRKLLKILIFHLNPR